MARTSPIPTSALGELIVRGQVLEMPLIEWVASVRSQSALPITWHAHAQFEMLFLLEGSTAYEFAGGPMVELPGGHFLVVAPNARHRGLHDVRQPASLCGILFDPLRRSANRHTPLARADLTWLRTQCEEFAMRAIPMSAELRRLVAQFRPQLEDLLGQKPAAAAALRLSVSAALLEAARQLSAPRALEPTRAVQAAMDCIEARYAESLSMDDVARAACCSRARLFPIFKESTGMTPHDYLQRLRVQRAQKALAETDASVTQVALDCGFTTSQYFSNVFRKFTGLAPSTFRERQAGSGA